MKRLWLVIFGIIVLCAKNEAGPPSTFSSSSLPIIVINTLGETIIDEPKVMVEMKVVYNTAGTTNHISGPYSYKGHATIEVRGSSSQSFPQKSYGFTTVSNSGEEINPPLLGMPPEHDWILYAPYTDKTLIRNVLTYRLGNEMGHYAPRTHFCELVIDSIYQGVYVLMEKIKRDEKRVNISKTEPTDDSGDQLTGGYIVKIDKTTGGGGAGWNSSYISPNNVNYPYFQYHYPNQDDLSTLQKAYLQNHFDHFEDTLKAAFYKDPLSGYAKFINVNSFIDFMIVNEISRNVDGYRLSSFFYKDRDSLGGQITAGPLWDFNLAWWNADYCEGYQSNGWAYRFPYYCSWDGFQPPFWWDRLMQDDAFKNKLRCRWEYLRSTVLATTRLHNMIDAYADTLNIPQGRHFEAWDILGEYVWPNPSPIATTYAGEIGHLKQWISDRTAWMDIHLPGNCASQPALVMSVSGSCLNSKMRLVWTTYSEKSVDRYEVQRKNSAGIYTKVGEVAATNLLGYKQYHYDDAISSNGSFMYRIAVVPTTGVTDYTDEIRVKKCNVFLSLHDAQVELEELISIVPNPSSAELSIRSEGNVAITGYDLYEVTGKCIGSIRLNGRPEAVTVTEATSLEPGIYTIKIYSEDKYIVKKIIRN